VVIVFQLKVLVGWTGATDDDLGLGRPTNTLVVLPLNALMLSESLAEGSGAETEFKDMLCYNHRKYFMFIFTSRAA
jgi:hypothetical protein